MHAPRTFVVFALGTLVLAGGVVTMSGCQSLDSWAMKRREKKRTPQEQQAIQVYEAKAEATNPQAPKLIAEESYAGADAMAKGRTLAQQGLEAEALLQFEAAIEKNPLLTAAYMGSGELHYKKGDLPKAEERFGKAALIEPSNFDAQYWHALVLQELKKFDESIRAYLRALSLRPDDIKANSNLSAAYLQAGEPKQALPYAQRAVQIAPNDASARINLGAIYATLGQHENAITEYQQAAELTELSPQLLLNLADSYGRVRRYEEMVGTLEQVIKLEPSAVAYERLGSGLFRLADYEGALEAFQQSTTLDENHYPAFNGVGVCLLRRWVVSGQDDTASREEALRALRKSLQIDRNQPRVLELVGRYQ
jgi:tetratricopeptide (TPR) repeat protein